MNLYKKIFLFFVAWNSFLFTHIEANTPNTSQYIFDFSKNNQDWQGEFSDYDSGQESFFELAWGWSSLPKEIVTADGKTLSKGIFLSGNNHSDDLFMFIRRRLSGLQPNANYDVIFTVTIENSVPPALIGVGGSPGESIYFKVGGSKIKPDKKEREGFYHLNVDKGDQGNGGKNAIIIGDLANPLVEPSNPQFEPKILTNGNEPLRIKTDKEGNAWIFVGTDSAFEGLTLYYIAEISIQATLVNE
jgi:hypothetical protein